MSHLDKWSFLWESGDYILHRMGESEFDCRILSINGDGALLIEEDHETSRALIQKMREEGVPEVTEPPKECFEKGHQVIKMMDSGMSADAINRILAEWS